MVKRQPFSNSMLFRMQADAEGFYTGKCFLRLDFVLIRNSSLILLVITTMLGNYGALSLERRL